MPIAPSHLISLRLASAIKCPGTSLLTKTNSGITLGSFGVVGAIFALQFFAEVPKVRNDILQVGLRACRQLSLDEGG